MDAEGRREDEFSIPKYPEFGNSGFQGMLRRRSSGPMCYAACGVLSERRLGFEDILEAAGVSVQYLA